MAILSHIYTYTKLNKIKKHSEENAKFWMSAHLTLKGKEKYWKHFI
jgi:hypothetical protein